MNPYDSRWTGPILWALAVLALLGSIYVSRHAPLGAVDPTTCADGPVCEPLP